MARDEEFFRKLKKQTPIVKRKDIQPLSSRDFDPRRSSLELPGARNKKRAKPAEISIFSDSTIKPSAKPADAKRSPQRSGRYVSYQQQAKQASLKVFGEEESAKPVKKTTVSAPRKADARQTQTLQAPIVTPRTQEPVRQAAVPAEKRSMVLPNTMARVDQHQIDYVQNTAPLGKSAFRHELKYYINYHDYVLLRNTIKTLLALDKHADSDGQYMIRSLYFDDIYETALHQKIAGTDDRYKYRIRIYNYSDDVIRFEKKIKKGEFISKKSFALSREDCDRLIAGDCSVLEGRREPLAGEIYLQMKNNTLRPRVVVDYWREAYVSPFENVRITFDKDIKGGLLVSDIFNRDLPTMPMLEEGIMVLEVKFDRYLPVHIKAVLNNIQSAQRSAISKYVLCRKYD